MKQKEIDRIIKENPVSALMQHHKILTNNQLNDITKNEYVIVFLLADKDVLKSVSTRISESRLNELASLAGYFFQNPLILLEEDIKHIFTDAHFDLAYEGLLKKQAEEEKYKQEMQEMRRQYNNRFF